MHPLMSKPVFQFPLPQNEPKMINQPVKKMNARQKSNSQSKILPNHLDQMKFRLNSLLQKTEFVINGHKRSQSFVQKERSQNKTQRTNQFFNEKKPPKVQIYDNSQQHQNKGQLFCQLMPLQTVASLPQRQPSDQRLMVSPHKNAPLNNRQKEAIKSETTIQFQKSKNSNRRVNQNRPPSSAIERRQENFMEKNVRTTQEVKQEVEENPERGKKTKEQRSNKKSKKQKKQKQEMKEKEISWTKYISLELKNDKLEKQLAKIEGGYKKKLQKVNKQLENKDRMMKNIAKKLIDEKKQYQERITKMEKDHEIRVNEKNGHIKKLVEQLSGLTLEEKEEIAKNKIKEIIQENERVKIQLSQREAEIKNLSHTLHLQEEKVEEKQQKEEELNQELEKQRLKVKNILKDRSFDEILKIKLDEISQLKEKIQHLHDENIQLKENIRSCQHETQKITNQIKISQIKEASYRNRIATQMGIKLNEKDNIIKSLQKKMLTMQDKYQRAMRQIKEKDQFLKQHLIGRTDRVEIKEYIENILEKYEKSFEEKKENRVEQLEREVQELNRKISYYEKNW